MSISEQINDSREARATLLEAPGVSAAIAAPCRRRTALARRAAVPALLLATVVLAIALRRPGVTSRSLWFDEAFSWRLSRSPVLETIERSARDNHPPLYFLLLKLWCVALGESPLALRSLSVASGALAAVGAFLLLRDGWPARVDGQPEGDAPSPQPSPEGRGGVETETPKRASARGTPQRAFPTEALARGRRGNWAGLCGAALVAANVFQVRWGWEARMYALGAALALLSSWAMFRALAERRRPWRAWGLYAVLGLAFAYTHVYALFSLAAQVVFLAFYAIAEAGRTRRVRNIPFARPMAVALAVMAVGWLAWTPFLLRQRSQVKRDFWSVEVKAWDIPDVCYRLLALPEDGSVSHTQAGWAAAFCAAVLLLLLWRPRAIDWYLVLATCAPFALSVLISTLDTKIFHPRYFVFAGAFFCVAAARLLSRLPDGFLGGLLSCAAIVNCVWISAAFAAELQLEKRPGMQAACRYIVEHGRMGEPVLVASPFFYLPARYHLAGAMRCHLLAEPGKIRHYEGAAALDSDDFLSAERLAALKAHRLWAIDNVRDADGWEARAVAVPDRWREVSRHTYREAYGVQGSVVLVEYIERHGPARRATESQGTRE